MERSLLEAITLIEWRLIRYSNRFFIEISASGVVNADKVRTVPIHLLPASRISELTDTDKSPNTKEKKADNGFSKDTERRGGRIEASI